MEDIYQEVYFGAYCKNCKHRNLTEEEDPCFECLAEPVNLYSHKPVRFEDEEPAIRKNRRRKK